MRLWLPGVVLLLLSSNAWAHRLDEYLQATRVSVATNRIELSLDLTPGVAVAAQVRAVIDSNSDGRFSAEERAAYVRRVLKDTRASLDGQTLDLHAVKATFPKLEEMKNGVGVIRIAAAAKILPLRSGDHVLSLTNGHLPTISVYLVNALVPPDRAIRISKQVRDEIQTAYRLDFALVVPQP